MRITEFSSPASLETTCSQNSDCANVAATICDTTLTVATCKTSKLHFTYYHLVIKLSLLYMYVHLSERYFIEHVFKCVIVVWLGKSYEQNRMFHITFTEIGSACGSSCPNNAACSNTVCACNAGYEVTGDFCTGKNCIFYSAKRNY